MKQFFTLIFFAVLTALPAAGQVPETFDVETTGSVLLVRGNTLYMAVAGKQNKLLVYDLSDPANPKLTASLAPGNHPQGLAAEGSKLYLVDGVNLHTYDLANPNQPKETAVKKIGEGVTGPAGVAVKDGAVYLANRAGGITLAGSPVFGFYARAVHTGESGRVYALGPRHLITLEPELERRLEILLTKGTPNRIRSNGGDLYVALGFHGFAVFRNAANLRSEWLVLDRKIQLSKGTFLEPKASASSTAPVTWQEVPLTSAATDTLKRYSAFGTFVYDMAFDADPARYVFLAANESGVVTVDVVSTPVELRPVALCGELLWHMIRGIARKDKFLYACDMDYGLRVLDCSDPVNLKLVGSGVPF